MPLRRVLVAAGVLTLLAVSTGGCGAGSAADSVLGEANAAARHRTVPGPFRNPLPGMPPVVGNSIYSQDGAGMLSRAVAHAPQRLYVPDSAGSTVTVINPRTRRIIRVIGTGYLTQHVVPSWDLTRLVANASAANRLVLINPRTGKKYRTISVRRPYNLYFTPNGKAAVIMEEEYNHINFANPRTFRVRDSVSAPGCQGPNHADFSANGRFFVVTCEFSGELVKVGTRSHRILKVLKLGAHPTARHASHRGLMGMAMPQDIRLSPDGRTLYVADMGTNEVRMIDPFTLRQKGAIGLPAHPHGLYPSRDGRHLYISDRGAGKISVLDFATNRVVDTWRIPGGGSPDMGGVSADGKTLWLTGRYDGRVYGFDTRTGRLVANIYVGGSPHGMAVWPQPGRYSLGHTGNMR